jgi:hypothetical protein
MGSNWRRQLGRSPQSNLVLSVTRVTCTAVHAMHALHVSMQQLASHG